MHRERILTMNIIRKKLPIILTAIITTQLLCASAQARYMNMYVNEQLIYRDMQTVGKFDMIPIKDIAGELGFKVSSTDITCTLIGQQNAYKFTLGDASVYDKYNNWYGLDVVPQIIDEKFMIPYNFLTKVLAVSYTWEPSTNIIFINSDQAYYKTLHNPYNYMGYIDVSGRTLVQVANDSGYGLADLIAQYNLPADMPGSTSESSAYYNIPCKKIAEMYGMDFAALKEMLKLGDDITEDTTWGVAEGETTVGSYVGEDSLGEFKKQYGFGDEVTAETKMKEVRNAMDQQSRDARIAEESKSGIFSHNVLYLKFFVTIFRKMIGAIPHFV